MTRAERLAQTAARAAAKLARDKHRLTQIESAQREEERKALTKRRLRWGTILDHLGLLALDDAALTQVLTVAYRLVQEGRVHWAASETEAEVEQLIAARATLVLVRESEGQPLEPVDGRATAAQCVAPGGAIGSRAH